VKNNHSTELVVALDFPKAEQAYQVVEQLQGLPLIYKVGLELFMGGGSEIVRELVHRKNRIFLDLKFYDIPNTVARAVKQAALLQVEMMTLHLAGGSAVFRAVAEELAEIPLLRPKVLGVSVLTSFDDVRWAEVTKATTGHATPVGESVAGLVEHASSWGADGVVCSAMELAEIRKLYPSLYTVVPGIRPEGSAANDQARVTTPSRAREMGAHAIVVGRPITGVKNSRVVVEKILKELAQDFEVSA
jgi:orotidine-5'-phosphate decarboxylase